MEKLKILVADPISPRGIDALAAEKSFEVDVKTGLSESELLPIMGDYSALVVRSQTKVTPALMEAAPKLRVVGRAGVGVDNVDVETATQRGIIVMNTPGGNTVSTAEHAFSLMVSMARNIPQAHRSIVDGRWDRKKYQGVELYNKTLGVLGMGRIGTEFAKRAIAFGMKVLAYDPYLSASRARQLQVELVEKLDDLLPAADFITLHMPLTDETHHLLDAERLALCKTTVRIINCARGGLVDETALTNALKNGTAAGAALDVYEVEPPPEDFALRELDSVVFTPHLGASTAEAQESVGIEIAEAIRAALLDGEIRNAVNVPSIDAKTLELLGPWIDLCSSLGQFLSQIAPKRVETLRVDLSGKIGEVNSTPLARSVLTGFLRTIKGSEVNQVNAPAHAANLGIQLQDMRSGDSGEFSEMIEVTAESETGTASVAGTFFGAKPRIVKVNGQFVEAASHGIVLMLENRDRPGIVGRIGSLLANQDINIARMSLSRDQAGGEALTLLNLDSVPSQEAVRSLLEEADIHGVSIIKLDEKR